MSIEEQIAARYPVLDDESQCRMLKNTRDGLREMMRQRLTRGMAYETKEGDMKEPAVQRDWFGNIMETKSKGPSIGQPDENSFDAGLIF